MIDIQYYVGFGCTTAIRQLPTLLNAYLYYNKKKVKEDCHWSYQVLETSSRDICKRFLF